MDESTLTNIIMTESLPTISAIDSSEYGRTQLSTNRVRILFSISLSLVPIGVIGNCIILCVFNRKTFNHSSTALLMKGLACYDLLSLFAWAYYFIQGFSPVFVTDYSIHICLVFIFAMMQCSHWTLVMITAERLTAVFLPYKAKLIWTKTKCRIALVLIFVVVTITNVLEAMVLESGEEKMREDRRQQNKSSKDYDLTADLKYKYGWVLFIFTSLAPSIPILVGNILLLWKLWRRSKKLRKMTETPTTEHQKGDEIDLVTISEAVRASTISICVIPQETNNVIQEEMKMCNSLCRQDLQNNECLQDAINANNEAHRQYQDSENMNRKSHAINETNLNTACSEQMDADNTTGKIICVNHEEKNNVNNTNEATIDNFRPHTSTQPQTLSAKTTRRRRKEGSSLNWMLLLVSFIFLATNIPVSVYTIYSGYYEKDAPHDPNSIVFTFNILICILSVNSSVNFLFYSLPGSRFREELGHFLASVIGRCSHHHQTQ